MLLRFVVDVGFPPVSKRTIRTIGQVSAGILLTLVAFVGAARPASAHNSFVGSDPADGAVIEKLPPKLTLTFASEVVLAQLTVDFTDATGSRAALSGFSHGPAGVNAVFVSTRPIAPAEDCCAWAHAVRSEREPQAGPYEVPDQASQQGHPHDVAACHGHRSRHRPAHIGRHRSARRQQPAASVTTRSYTNNYTS